MTIQSTKGIILAGGSGSRLSPITKAVSKQLLPIYDKPMVYYPLSVLMQAGIKEILLISSPQDINSYERLLGNGSTFGISIEYKIQENPEGIGQAFILGEDFIGNGRVALILGDNIFYGSSLKKHLQNALSNNNGATLFGYHVSDPERYGVLEFDANQEIINIEEKPVNPKSNYAVTGLYFYDNNVINISKSIKPSQRGEIEITDINNVYLKSRNISVEILGRDFAWLDTGTHESLLEAGIFIKTTENRQSLKVACLEEIAFINGWINRKELETQAKKLKNTSYGSYLHRICSD
jgi:glucose-1-phosphate thymidylyltransferase